MTSDFHHPAPVVRAKKVTVTLRLLLQIRSSEDPGAIGTWLGKYTTESSQGRGKGKAKPVAARVHESIGVTDLERILHWRCQPTAGKRRHAVGEVQSLPEVRGRYIFRACGL